MHLMKSQWGIDLLVSAFLTFALYVGPSSKYDPGRFTHRGRGWQGRRADLGTLEKKKISSGVIFRTLKILSYAACQRIRRPASL
jgi:hypothetical protein